MRGHIRKRSKDSWTVVVELPRDPETGKRRQKWVSVRGTKKDAEKVLAELITKVEQAEYGTAPARMTVGEYLDMWLDTVKQVVRPSTYSHWKSRINYWKKLLGSKPLAKLTTLDVQRAVNMLPEHWADSSKGAAFTALRAALKQAVVWKLIPRSNTEGVKVPRPVAKEFRVWTEEQVGQFLEAAATSRYYALFHTAVATGMRLSELRGLTWEDVDLDEGVIHVRRILVPGSKPPNWQEPKTAASRRKIVLDPVTVEVLRQHRKRQVERRLKLGPAWHDYNLVFTTRTGNAVPRESIQWVFRRLIQKTGLPKIRFHDLRHTHATIMLQRGVHPKVVSERLGHTEVSFTLQVYSHVLPDIQREASRAMGEVFEGLRVSKALAKPNEKS